MALEWIALRIAIVVLALGAALVWWWRSDWPYKRSFMQAMGLTVLAGLAGYGILALILWRLHLGSNFGWSSILLAPFLNGFLFVFLFHWLCRKHAVADYRPGFIRLALLAPLALAVVELLAMFALLLEGGVCILMAAPFWLAFTVAGAVIAYLVMKFLIPKITGRQMLSVVLLSMLPLGIQPLEAQWLVSDEYHPVTSAIVIHASPEKVFDLVVAFPPIPQEPPQSAGESMFVLGLPEPESATVDCRAEGCNRHCWFNQNVHFDERITRYEPGRELDFNVKAVVGPQNPITGVDPHVAPGGIYFVTDRGRFLLTETAPGVTRLEGTSWYRLSSSVNWYARPWAEAMLHGIHARVLRHVKTLAEAPSQG